MTAKLVGVEYVYRCDECGREQRIAADSLKSARRAMLSVYHWGKRRDGPAGAFRDECLHCRQERRRMERSCQGPASST